MANPAQTNTTDDDMPDDAPEPSASDVGTPASDSPQAVADSVAPKGSAYHGAVSSEGLQPTIVTPGSIYNGVRVPFGAKSVAGGNWMTEGGQIMADEPVNPDGSVNEHSSAYVSNLRESMLDAGVNPFVVDAYMKPIYSGAKATQDMLNNTSDKMLSQIQANQTIKNNQQAIQKNQTDLSAKYNSSIAEAYSAGGPQAASQVLGQFISMIDSADSSGKLVKQFFPQMDGTPQGLQATIKTAVAQGAAAAQQAQASLTQTKLGSASIAQNIGVQQFGTGEQAIASLNAGQNAVTSGAITANRSQTAIQLFDDLYRKGDIGGNYNNIMSKLNALASVGGDNPDAAKAQELRAYLSLDNLTGLKNAFGQRIAASEYNQISPTQINPNWQASAIRDFLGNNSNYAKVDLNNKQAEQNSIITNVKKLPFNIDTSSYEQNLSNVGEATKTVNQNPEKRVTMVNPQGLKGDVPESQVKAAIAKGYKPLK